MGDRVICPTAKLIVGQGVAVRRKNGLAPLPHHLAPKGAVVVVGHDGARSPFTVGWGNPDRSQCPAIGLGGEPVCGVALSRCAAGGGHE